MPKFEVNVWWQCARSVVVEADSAEDINYESVILETIEQLKGEPDECGKTIGDLDVGPHYVDSSFEITPGEELK